MVKHLEKRIRKHVRINKLFGKHDRIYVKDKLCSHILKSIIKELPVKFVRDAKNASKIVVPWTLDDEINQFLHSIFSKKKIIEDKRIVKLLKPLTDKEAALLSKSKKLPFKPNKKDNNIQHILNKLDKEHPEIKYGLLKTSAEVKKILGN